MQDVGTSGLAGGVGGAVVLVEGMDDHHGASLSIVYLVEKEWGGWGCRAVKVGQNCKLVSMRACNGIRLVTAVCRIAIPWEELSAFSHFPLQEGGMQA